MITHDEPVYLAGDGIEEYRSRQGSGESLANLIIPNGTNEGRDSRLPPNQNPSGGGGQLDDNPSSDDDFGGDGNDRP